MHKLFLLAILLIVNCLPTNAQLDIRINIEKAQKEIYEDKNKEAIERLNKVIKLKPDYFLAYFIRGNAKLGLRDIIGAIEDYSEVISLNPFYSDAYYNRGVARNAINDYNNAIIDYDRAIRMDVNNPGLFINRGLTRLNIKNFSAAIEDFNMAIKLNPTIPDVYVYRGVAKANLKQYEAAINDCNYAISLNQFQDEAFLRRGLIKFEQEKFKEAIADYDISLKLKNDNSQAYYLRALAKYHLKDFEGTMNDYSKVIELSPYNALAYYNRAMLHMEMEKLSNAVLDLSRVVEINPVHVLSYYNRGIIYGRQKEYLNALKDFSRAIQLYPDFGEAYYMRSLTNRNLGRIRLAEQDYIIAKAMLKAQDEDTTIAIINAKKYQNLIELEADFNNNLVGGDRIYSVYSGIDPLPNYLLNLYAKSHKKNLFSELDEAHFQSFDTLHLMIGNQPDTLIDIIQILSKVNVLIKENRDDYLSWYIKGVMDAQLQNFNSSVEAFTKVIELNPNFVFALLSRANTQINAFDFINSIDEGIQIGNDKITNNSELDYDYTYILDDYNRAIEINPDLAITYYNRANLKVRAKDYDEAFFDYNRAIKLEPDFADAYYNMALLLIYQQKVTQACLALSKAGELGQEKAYLVIQRYCKK